MDVDLTLYRSVARIASWYIDEIYGEYKMKEPTILQTEALFIDDMFKGFIVEFAENITEITGITFQTFLTPSVRFEFFLAEYDSYGRHKLIKIKTAFNLIPKLAL